MNGGADLGGMMGFGPVTEEADEPHFHAAWEARVLGIVVAMGASGAWNLDQSRFARESLPPVDYLRWPFYRIWLEGLSKLLVERGLLSAEELAEGKASAPPAPIKRRLSAAEVPAALAKGGPVDREAKTTAAFAPGDTVRTINLHPSDHTRLPRYARAKTGVITRIHGCHVFPDSNAKGLGEDPQWLYQVRFTAQELWGQDRAETITLDLWQPYLTPAP